MENNKNKTIIVLSVILAIGVIVVIILGVFAIVKFNQKENEQTIDENKEANNTQQIQNEVIEEIEDNTVAEENTVPEIPPIEITTKKVSETLKAKQALTKEKYEGYDVSGRIEIPKTNLDYPILTNASVGAIEIAVGIQYCPYGEEVNEEGNVVLASHNFQNGKLFSNNYLLEVGDEIYITDTLGTRYKYIIYDKFTTTPEDTTYMTRDTKGKMEISLTTCTNNEEKRLIILAKKE